MGGFEAPEPPPPPDALGSILETVRPVTVVEGKAVLTVGVPEAPPVNPLPVVLEDEELDELPMPVAGPRVVSPKPVFSPRVPQPTR